MRVKGVRKLGVRLGNWLTAEEARRFWQAPSADTIKGRRDRAILAILLGCGLRRRELADLELTHLQLRDEHWAIVDLVGKGGHIRTVPVPDWVKAAVDLWVVAAGISAGRLFRCVCRAGKCWGVGVTERVVWHVVKDYAKRSVWAKLPHTTFVVRARNYVTQRAENWNRFNSSSATFRFKLRSATLVANSGSAERSTTGSVSNRSAEGNGRPTSAARCRTRGATWRLFAQVDFRREIRPIAFVDPGAFLVPNPARSPTRRLRDNFRSQPPVWVAV